MRAWRFGYGAAIITPVVSAAALLQPEIGITTYQAFAEYIANTICQVLKLAKVTTTTTSGVRYEALTYYIYQF